MSRNSLSRVYVGNLGSNGIKSELEKEFSKFGIVKDVWIARNPPGFAFVEFDDHRDAEDAVRELDGRRMCGVHVRVQVSNHQGRTARQPPPANRGRSRYSPEDRSYGNQRGRFEEDRYRRDTRPARRRERSPEMDRNPRRFSRSRSRSPPRYY